MGDNLLYSIVSSRRSKYCEPKQYESLRQKGPKTDITLESLMGTDGAKLSGYWTENKRHRRSLLFLCFFIYFFICFYM